MTSENVLTLMKQLPSHILHQMKRTVAKGSVIWFVDDETGNGEVCVFACDCGGPHKDSHKASTALCDFLGIPDGELWIGKADHVQVAPNMGHRLARHERG